MSHVTALPSEDPSQMPGVLVAEQPRARSASHGLRRSRRLGQLWDGAFPRGDPVFGGRGWHDHVPGTDGVAFRFSKHSVHSIDMCLAASFFTKCPSRGRDTLSLSEQGEKRVPRADCFWRRSDVRRRKPSMGRAAFRVCCLGSALEPNSFFLSLFFFSLSEWQKAQKYKFPCQEMALNIVLGGQEDRVLANATGVCVRPSRPSVGGAGPRRRLSPAVPTARGGGGPGRSSSRVGLRSTQPPPRWPPPLFRREGAGGHMAVASEQPGKSAPCTARVTTSGFGGGEKPRSPLCVHREGGAGCRVRDSSASRVLVSRLSLQGERKYSHWG